MKNLLVALSLLISLSTLAQHQKPFVIPELRDWQGGSGTFTVSAKTKIQADALEIGVASQFAADYKKMFGAKPKIIAMNKKNEKDIRFLLQPDLLKEYGDEAYRIEIGHSVLVTANSTTGLYWGTRTLLQMLEQSNELPQGVITDYPDYPKRGFMLDVGRKFFPMDYLQSVVKLMSYYKMNTFQVHLNDNGFIQHFGDDWSKTYSAFRLESETYPGLTAKDGHYGKDEFRQFQLDALAQGVTVIPEIDAPAHTLAFSHFMPEIGSEEYGMDHLDLFSPKTYEFLDGLFKEYLEGDNPVFVNEYVHIGTDEYSNKDSVVVEKFRYFTDYYIKEVEKYGKKAVLWGALTHAKGKTPVKVDDVLMNVWYNGYAQPHDMMKLGYDVLSVPDGILYIVPAAGYYHDYLNTKHIYENWTPAVIGKEIFEEKHPQIKGGMFAVWNDQVGNGISTQDVYHRLFPAMQTLAVKMWTGKNVQLPFADFDSKRKALSEAPGQNRLAIPVKSVAGVVFEVKKPRQGKALNQKLDDIGWNYRVSFDVTARANTRGTALFTSDNSVFYLLNPQDGRLGFSRNGYDYQFNYSVPLGQKVSIAIEGTNAFTALFVNGELKDKLETIPHKDDTHVKKDKRKWVQTLVFPLKGVGKFNGKIENLKVEYLGD
ncbi:MAG: family 20 glycosylhydrolase [Bacteroidia bacterium]|nr:family 20 glycosylhydrolase [Bacteroidia bacterium]